MYCGNFYFIKGDLKYEFEKVHNLLTKHSILECIKNKKELSKIQYDIYRLLDNGVSHYILMTLIYMNNHSNFITWKIKYIQMNYKNVNLLLLQNRIAFLYKRAISNPEYKLCKHRLIRECIELMN